MLRDGIRSSDVTHASRNAVCEIEFIASREPADPWAEIELDVEFSDPDGTIRTVPAFWAGGRSWRVRYSSRIEGVHPYVTVVQALEETGLENLRGEVTITGYHGANPLLLHGAPIVAPDRRHLAYADGTPFFWLADTWWSAMTARFRWPETFKTLADDRVAKGFSVIQIVAGLVPEFVPFSAMTASEGGQPWHDKGNGPINPAFYDVPDLKIDYLVAKGLVPCIVGGWGSWADMIGHERVGQHWRYLVARYSAYPVVWCIAGEVDLTLPFWGGGGDVREEDVAEFFANLPVERMDTQVAIWEDASRLVAEIDPFERIRTVHPCPLRAWSSSEVFKSRDSFELDMLQTGHAGRNCVPDTMKHLHMSLAHGDKPVLNGECSYEGIYGGSWHDTQRFVFWSHMLSGTAGHTYGTMPISTFSSRDDPYVPLTKVSVHDWEEAIEWPGAKHVGIGRRILEQLRWWELRPAPESIEPHAGPGNWFSPYASVLPDGSRVIYLPGQAMREPLLALKEQTMLVGLTPGGSYRATYVNPRTGVEQPPITFRTEDGNQLLLTLNNADLPRSAVSAAIDASLFTIDASLSIFEAPTGEDWVLIVRPLGPPLASCSEKPW